MGGKFADYDNREVPDTLEVLWHYPGDTLVTFSQYNASAALAAARDCEIEFRGTKGTLYLNLNGYEIVPEVILPNEFFARTPVDRAIERRYRQGGTPTIDARRVAGRVTDTEHARNFLDCVKSRHQPNCDIEFAHRATSSAQIANVAHRTRSLLEWDAKSEQFTNHPAANEQLRYEYRPPYEFPG
jgi:predicted dehydrogenase